MVAPALAAFDLMGEALGLMATDTRTFHEEVKAKRLGAMGLTVDQVEDKLRERSDARAAKDWARADAIREELEAQRIMVMDRPDGVEWRVRVYQPGE